MNMLRENMRLITECSQQLVRLGENLFAKGITEEDVDLIPKFGEYSDNEPLDVPTMTTEFVKEHGLPCPEGYIFKDENNNVINTTKIVLEKNKKEYPKTYKECCAILNEQADVTYGYKKHVLHALQKLLVCRDAYWKIAGEEMGLGKPWEPDWSHKFGKYSVISAKDIYTIAKVEWGYGLLAFPTAEMRDAFKENFDPDLEICKEFL